MTRLYIQIKEGYSSHYVLFIQTILATMKPSEPMNYALGTNFVVALQVSFVNSICTVKGGTHVKLIVDQICKCDARSACSLAKATKETAISAKLV
jgi:DNA gyrase/topoisomerase IV subunit B